MERLALGSSRSSSLSSGLRCTGAFQSDSKRFDQMWCQIFLGDEYRNLLVSLRTLKWIFYGIAFPTFTTRDVIESNREHFQLLVFDTQAQKVVEPSQPE